MARSAVTIAQAVINTGVAITKDAIDIANDHEIDIKSFKDSKLALFIETLDTKAAVFTVKKGTGPQSILGDLTITTGAAGLRVLDVESARFKDADGKILIDIVSTAGATGNIYAIAKA
jgi:hypothetical protein